MFSPYLRAQFKIFKHNLNLEPGEVKLRLRRHGPRYLITAGDEKLVIVSPQRWRYYKKGLTKRTEALAREFGYEEIAHDLAGKTVIDIGSNMGEFSLLASRRGARTYAIEPDPFNIPALTENLAGTGVDITPCALWFEDSTLTFYSSTAGSDSSLITPLEIVNDTVKVRARRLDDIAAEKGIDKVYLIKADAEGAEPEVLTGAKELLKRTKYIAIDCGPERQGQDTIDAASAILQDCGFTTRVLPGSRCIVFGENNSVTF